MTKNYEMHNLNEIIEAIGKLPVDATIQGVTTEWFSDRGSYRNLAIQEGEGVPAMELYKALTEAIGQTMTGWKGGEFEVRGGNVVSITSEEGRSGDHIIGIEPVAGLNNTWEFVTVSNAWII